MTAMVELIDTLWNVNEKACAEYNANIIELIDTLWNVNFYAISNYKCLS